MDGNVQTYKGRLVAKGFRQIHGIDYDETFSPVAMIKSIQILLAIAAFHDYEIWKMDVKTAFLNGKLEEDVYMTQLEGFVTPGNRDAKAQYLDYIIWQEKKRTSLQGIHDPRILPKPIPLEVPGNRLPETGSRRTLHQSILLEVPGNRLPETGSRRTLLPARALTKDPESTNAENSSTCRDTYLDRQGKYNRECDMISIFFQTPLDQERVKPRPKTICRADPKPKHTKSTWSTSLSQEKSCFIKITLLYDF
ncbi:hypothetical protein V6N12_010167 [Hibiscus sabdariffa]|uniref:Reverse transcriptase Ty1/copia-type domain-containing protein n=1 Tax=Hibiscus sabdariffa TaxID=183260 RepID=A0ABR2ECW3_9ROSI